MAPLPAGAALLFHPKKNAKKPIASPRPKSPTKPPATKPNATKPAVDDDAPPPLPDGPYTEYKLISSALNGWKYDVMKFDSRKPVDVFTWEQPVKLNRKDLRRQSSSAQPEETESKAVAPMMGPDGKPVIGADGRVVMVDAEGKPIHPGQSSTTKEKAKDGAQKKKKFQKKTKQVFKIPEATRQLRREERYPWVMEDSRGNEIWVGSMEEASKAETHAFFMPAQNNSFKFVPAHRWYKFQKKPTHYIPTLEEAEALMAARNKNKDPSTWLRQKRGGQAPSAATAAMFKAEAEGTNDGMANFAPNGRRLRTVRREDELFGDDEEGSSRRRRGDGADADFEEIPYHEEFADDEEKAGPEDEEDEVEKEMEERLQREYMSANKQRDGQIDEDTDEEEDEETSTAKAMRKLLTKRDKNAAYDSDDEKNPYASSEEEEEEEQVVTNEPAVQSHLTTKPSRPQTPVPTKPSQSNAPAPSNSDSRPTSPIVGSPVPDHGGHSIVAKRATSPKVPKPKAANGVPRASSPLAQNRPNITNGTTVRPTNPSSPTSPNGTHGGIGAAQSSSAGTPGKKRKAEDTGDAPVAGTSTEGQPKLKKRKPVAPALDANGNPIELTDDMVLDWLRQTPNVKTKDCIGYFTPYLHDEQKKGRFIALIKSVASLKDGVLVLKSVYRKGGTSRGSNAPSPTPGTPMDTA